MSETGEVSRLGVTVGDPAGIGPEVVSTALRTLSSAGGTFRVYGDISAVERAGGVPEQVELEDTASAPATPGNPDPATASGVIEAIRRVALAGTDMARAQAGTIRLKLLRVGAVVIRNTRRVSVHLSSACPDKAVFHLVAARLAPG